MAFLHDVQNARSRVGSVTIRGMPCQQEVPESDYAAALELTAAGREVLAELARARAAALAEIVDRMSEPERAALLAGIRAFSRAAGQPRAEEDPGEVGRR